MCRLYSNTYRTGTITCNYFLFFLDSTPEERNALFLRKLEQCCYVFEFTDPMVDVRAKEVKRAALNEVLDYITSQKGVLTDGVYPEVTRMVRINAFRTLPPISNPDYDPDEDEPPLEASWPHLEVCLVYSVCVCVCVCVWCIVCVCVCLVYSVCVCLVYSVCVCVCVCLVYSVCVCVFGV